MTAIDLPPFRPHPLLRSGHAQTIAGVYFPGRLSAYAAQKHHIALDDGDQLVLHDDRPADWQNGQRVALLVHGLGGCHSSPYLIRITAKLLARGVRVFRIDLRGWGDGALAAKLPFHAARTGDIAAALQFVAEQTHHSPTALVGFSLGGNMVLKLLADAGQARRSPQATGETPVPLVDRAMAVAPPMDLMYCCRNLNSRMGRVYDRKYAKFLWDHLTSRVAHVPAFAAAVRERPPRTIYEFDERFTAPLGGFASVEDYYAAATSHEVARHIAVPTLIISAYDDPIVPGQLWQRIALSPTTKLHLTDHGGHLGFIAAKSGDSDRRWMDWRVVDWVCG
jgi:predicted alpha/beta-fold hydrolase